MRTADLDIILVPGQPVGDGHWIARWARNLKTAEILAPPETTPADMRDWGRRLVARAAQGDRPTLVIGHALGASLTALAAEALAEIPIAGAVLVAPHEMPLAETAPGAANAPAELPTERLAFPVMVISSRNAPNMALERAQALAASWEALFVDAGEAGSIDESSGHGPWPEGLMRLGRFLKHLQPAR